jgi:hypothetical protein
MRKVRMRKGGVSVARLSIIGYQVQHVKSKRTVIIDTFQKGKKESREEESIMKRRGALILKSVSVTRICATERPF